MGLQLTELQPHLCFKHRPYIEAVQIFIKIVLFVIWRQCMSKKNRFLYFWNNEDNEKIRKFVEY